MRLFKNNSDDYKEQKWKKARLCSQEFITSYTIQTFFVYFGFLIGNPSVFFVSRGTMASSTFHLSA